MKPELEERLKVLKISTALSNSKLRAALRKVIKESHPDVTGGEFFNSDQREKYEAAIKALELLEQIRSLSSSTELQTLAQNQTTLAESHAALVRILEEQKRLSADVVKQRAVENTESRANEALARNVRQKYFPLRIGGWTAAGLAATIAILNQPLGGVIEQIFADDPTVIKFAKSVLAVIVVLGIILGLYAERKRIRETDRLKSILTDAGMQHLFYRYSYLIFDREADVDCFTVSSLSEAIIRHASIQDRSVCEATAEAIVQKLMARGAITQLPLNGISVTYEMNSEASRAIERGAYWNLDPVPLHQRLISSLAKFWKRLTKRKKDTSLD